MTTGDAPSSAKNRVALASNLLSLTTEGNIHSISCLNKDFRII